MGENDGRIWLLMACMFVIGSIVTSVFFMSGNVLKEENIEYNKLYNEYIKCKDICTKRVISNVTLLKEFINNEFKNVTEFVN